MLGVSPGGHAAEHQFLGEHLCCPHPQTAPRHAREVPLHCTLPADVIVHNRTPAHLRLVLNEETTKTLRPETIKLEG